ncbi:hypothetical protein ABMY26_32090 [Azospirillum sp. HJ39]|uniref:hypothetical protein n=1 Tax=Azospirillum sp. HJ39 TaxID=3159496 RepID=UPI00355934AF
MTLVEADKPRVNQTKRLAGSRIVWAEMRRLKSFKARDLHVPGTTRQIVATFLFKSIKAGLVIVDKEGSVPTYRLERDVGRRCPRFTADGRLDPIPAPNERIWAAIKPLRGGFTVRELASLTRCSESGAWQYVAALRRHGYLETLVAPVGRSKPVEGRYRLKKGKNTGPDAPQALRGGRLWDPNLGRLVDEVTE